MLGNSLQAAISPIKMEDGGNWGETHRRKALSTAGEKGVCFCNTVVLNKNERKNLFNTTVLNKLKITIILIQWIYAETYRST